jgi:hypothetical protein
MVKLHTQTPYFGILVNLVGIFLGLFDWLDAKKSGNPGPIRNFFFRRNSNGSSRSAQSVPHVSTLTSLDSVDSRLRQARGTRPAKGQ